MIEVTYLMASTEALIRSLTSIISRNLNVALVLTNVFLGIVALSVPYFTKYLERHVFTPKLDILFKLEPPFCHLTSWRIISVNGNPVSEPVYYFRFLVRNAGKSRARGCEVVLNGLWIHKDGQKKKIQNFSPINLQWTAGVVGQAPPQYIDINPENRGYFCNIGHISSRRYQIEREKFIDAPGFPACTANHSRFMFDFLQVFNAQSNYLCPGIKYTLEIGVYSENSSYKNAFFDILWSGNWKDRQEDMFKPDTIDIQLRDNLGRLHGLLK
jgi:hypothetical protein